MFRLAIVLDRDACDEDALPRKIGVAHSRAHRHVSPLAPAACLDIDRKTLMGQKGEMPRERREFLQKVDDWAIERLVHRWEPIEVDGAVF